MIKPSFNNQEWWSKIFKHCNAFNYENHEIYVPWKFAHIALYSNILVI